MRVHFDYDRQWGRVMQRITEEFKKYSPSEIEYVEDPAEAEFQIVHMIGLNDQERIKTKNFAVMFHCFDQYGVHDIRWREIFEASKLVYSFHPLNWFYPFAKINLLIGPWGVDPETFYQERLPMEPQAYACLNTGYVTATECIYESAEAATMLDKKIIHIGGSLDKQVDSMPAGYERKEKITDAEMRQAYNDSEFVCGLRRGEGFELPVIEGLLCGARPVCFETPYYYWFRDFAEFIPEDEKTTEHLLKLYKQGARPVTQEEKDFVKHVFSWQTITNCFWSRIL